MKIFNKLAKQAIFLLIFLAISGCGIYKKVDSIHFITNILSLIVFPFICSPIIMKMEKLNKTDFNKMMNQRKKLIPEWIIQMIKK